MPPQASVTDVQTVAWRRIHLPLLVMIAGFTIGCTTTEPRFSPASDAGRRACIEEVQANYAPRGRVQAMQQCMTTIDGRLEDLRQLAAEKDTGADTNPVPSTTPSSAEDRYLYCRLHQGDVQAAERERQKRQSILITASKHGRLDNDAYIQAEKDYNLSVARLEALIPPPMRNGLPLIPEAITLYSSCNPDHFYDQSR